MINEKKLVALLTPLPLESHTYTYHNNHVQKTFHFFRCLSRETGGFNAIHQSASNLLSIPDFLEETAVFLYTLDAKRLILSTDANDKIVVVDSALCFGSLDIRIV
jgi:hypothetical protein